MARLPVVDKNICIGCGACVANCPGVFRLDSDGKSECFDPAGAAERDIQDAIDNCPVTAISWK